MVWVRVKIRVSQEGSCEVECPFTADANHANAASPGRRRECDDGACCLHF